MLASLARYWCSAAALEAEACPAVGGPLAGQRSAALAAVSAPAESLHIKSLSVARQMHWNYIVNKERCWQSQVWLTTNCRHVQAGQKLTAQPKGNTSHACRACMAPDNALIWAPCLDMVSGGHAYCTSGLTVHSS